MTYLFPRIPKAVAEVLASERRALPPDELAALSDRGHPDAFFGSTGGTRVRDQELGDLQGAIRELMARGGSAVDADMAICLYESMDITPNEAGKSEVWYFMTCVLLPDVVRIRFPGTGESGTTLERFTGSATGQRNCLARLWWRAYTLQDESAEDPWWLLKAFGEDELVQVMERSAIAASPRLARTFLAQALEGTVGIQGPRTEVLRDAIKRVRRLNGILAWDALTESDLADGMREMVRRSVLAITGAPAATPTGGADQQTRVPGVGLAATLRSRLVRRPPSSVLGPGRAEVGGAEQRESASFPGATPASPGIQGTAIPVPASVDLMRLTLTASDVGAVGEAKASLRVPASAMARLTTDEAFDAFDQGVGIRWRLRVAPSGVRAPGEPEPTMLLIGIGSYLQAAGASAGDSLVFSRRSDGAVLMRVERSRG